MSAETVYVVSDVHLGAGASETERQFRSFLRHVADAAPAGLLINGDLFDFWFEYRTVVPRQHVRVVAMLAEQVEAGLPIWFVGGNHDGWADSFLRDEIGLRLIDGPARMTLAGRRCLVAHGDGVGTGDLGYRILRRVIRHRATTGAFRLLHPDLGSRIANLASDTEKRTAGHDPGVEGRARFIEQWARSELFEDQNLEIVLAGHAHLPSVVEVEPGRFYANSGDWIQHFTFLVIPSVGAPELRTWTR